VHLAHKCLLGIKDILCLLVRVRVLLATLHVVVVAELSLWAYERLLLITHLGLEVRRILDHVVGDHYLLSVERARAPLKICAVKRVVTQIGRIDVCMFIIIVIKEVVDEVTLLVAEAVQRWF